MKIIRSNLSGIVKAGYVCLLMSLIVLPYLFGLTAFILGIIATTKEQQGGILLVIASPVVALISAWIGQMFLMGV